MGDYPGRIEPIPTEVQEQMRGVCWHADPRCPPFEELSLLRLPYRGMDGRDHVGELVVAHSVADAVVWVFGLLHAARFPIARMERIERYGGDDDRSMAANNCSGFNFRLVAGTDRLSNHALGLAIDINPVQNPWVRGDTVVPEAGRAYLDRDGDAPGLIRRPGPVIDAFADIGWEWGGDWQRHRDYHHFAAV